GERGLVGRVGEVLRLQAEGVALLVAVSALAGDGAVEEVAGVELYARLGREDLHDPARRRLGDEGGPLEAGPLPHEDEVVVVPPPADELLVLLPDPGPDGERLPELERGAAHRPPPPHPYPALPHGP